MKKILYPNAINTVLSHDGAVRVGNHVIGEWSKEVVESGFHFRPSANEGRTCYYVNIFNGPTLRTFYKDDLYDVIENECKSGVEVDE